MFSSGFGRILGDIKRRYKRSKTQSSLGKNCGFGTSQVRYKRIKKTTRKKQMNSTNDEPFDPDDLAEMAARFSGIIRDAGEGFTMEFVINRSDAKEIIQVWKAAIDGDKLALAMCFAEFGKIVTELEQALRDEN